MITKLLKIKNPLSDREAVNEAAALIRAGELVAIPTETVYGLAANALDPVAVEKIFRAKGRPMDNPLIVHILDPQDLNSLCPDVPERARLLTRTFWPGPLTVIVPRREHIPDIVTAGLDTVAVRCPAHPATRALIEASGLPIAAPSANISGKPSATDARGALSDFNGRIAAVVDGGPCAIGLESTVVDMTCEPPRLLRPGGITLEELKEILGEVECDPALTSEPDPTERVRSPGMKYRHYAPDAELFIVHGEGARAARYIRYQAESTSEECAVLCFDEELPLYKGLTAQSYGRAADPRTLAKGLFSALRLLDAAGVDVIYARCPEEKGLGAAVANRLRKAAGFQVIEV